MRQAPNQFGVVQRQVTARPTASLQAPQQQILIDPNASRFADALVQFADTAGRVQKERSDALKDAQAMAADLGLDGYNDAMSNVLKTRPDILEHPDEFDKIDREMRAKYFKDITDEEILGKVHTRLDSWVDTRKTTYTYAKQEKQRLDLGTNFFINTVKKVEAQHQAGQLDEGQAVEALRAVFTEMRNSPSFQFSQEQTEQLVKGLQDVFAKDGSHRVLLAKTFMNDESLSPELRLALEADLAEGLAMTTEERKQAQFELYQQYEPMIEAGRLTWEHLDEPVRMGIISPDDARSMMRRQQARLEKRIKEAQEKQAMLGMNPLLMDSKQFKAWEEYMRNALFEKGEQGKLQYYTLMRQFGGSNPVLKAQANRAFSLASTPVEANDQIPAGFQYFMNEAQDVWRMGLLSQHVPPEKLADTHAYLFMTQTLGYEPYEAYNLLVQSPSAKFSDLDRLDLRKIESALRDELDIGEGVPTDIPAIGANVAMKLRKHTGMDQKEVIKEVVKAFEGAFHKTKFGPVPVANVPVGGDALVQRLEHAAKVVIEQAGVDEDDLVVDFTSDGRFRFFPRGSDKLSPLGALEFELVTSDEDELPDGRKTIEGRRKDAVIDDILSKTDPLGGASLYDVWRSR